MESKLTIVVPAHDSYKEIVDLYIKALKKNWSDCPYRIIWANGIEELESDELDVINCGADATFCQRLMKALDDVDTDYVLLTIEDLIISKAVNTQDIETLLECMERNDYKYCKLLNSNKYRNSHKDSDYPYVRIAESDMPYGLSINCGIFKTDYLKSLVLDLNWTPWDLENYFLLKAKNKQLEGCIYDSRDSLNLVHLIAKGKIIPTSERKLDRRGIYVNLSTKWERQSMREYISFNFISLMLCIIPKNMRGRAKKIASAIGIKTVTKY